MRHAIDRSNSGVAVALVAAVLVGCSFRGAAPRTAEEVHNTFDAAPIFNANEGGVISDAPGKVRIMNGYSCTDMVGIVNPGGDRLGFRMQNGVALAPGQTGTVFLQGWRADYQDGAHHVLGLGATLSNIRIYQDETDRILQWDAGGLLSDLNGDDIWNWCYWYGVIIWDEQEIGLSVVDRDEPPYENTTYVTTYGSDPNGTTAVRKTNQVYRGSMDARAVLPRGFGLLWDEANDHHIFQIGYDLHNVNNGIGRLDGPVFNWDTHWIMKDNADKRNYWAGSLVSIIGGAAATSWRPDFWYERAGESNDPWVPEGNTGFALKPRAQVAPTAGTQRIPGYRKRDYKVENVPFDYAMPVLTSWEIGDPISDTEVKSMGVILTGIRYDKSPELASGTLYYTVATVFEDAGGAFNNWGNESYHAVTILGIDDVPPAAPPKPRPRPPGNPFPPQ